MLCVRSSINMLLINNQSPQVAVSVSFCVLSVYALVAMSDIFSRQIGTFYTHSHTRKRHTNMVIHCSLPVLSCLM